jgi:hypothetical protein
MVELRTAYLPPAVTLRWTLRSVPNDTLPLTHSRIPDHEAFLASPEWKRIRRDALAQAGYRCDRCATSDRLEVHHLTYERFGGQEQLEDLRVLCRTCHQQVHDDRNLFGIAVTQDTERGFLYRYIQHLRSHGASTLESRAAPPSR